MFTKAMVTIELEEYNDLKKEVETLRNSDDKKETKFALDVMYKLIKRIRGTPYMTNFSEINHDDEYSIITFTGAVQLEGDNPLQIVKTVNK